MPGIMTTEQYERSQFYRCYTLGHAWVDYDSNWNPGFGTPLTLRCERCGTERRDIINPNTGQLLPGRKYIYPQGYRYGTERPTRDNFRVMLLKQRLAEVRARRSA